MVKGGGNGSGMIVAIGTVVAVAILIGGYTASPSYGKTTHFETPFESSLVPTCDTEEVVFSGIAKFSFYESTNPDGKTHQSVHMHYVNVRGEGITSGTQYIIHENDHDILIDEENSDTIRTLVSGAMIGQGNAVNSLVKIRMVTILDDNGNGETIVDDVDIKCNDGE
jgi:hypothetical protein